MAKILISSLGTGRRKSKNSASRDYEPTKYKFGDIDKLYETSFVASALSDHLKVDKLFLVGTSKSMWEEVYNFFAHAANLSFNDDYWAELGRKADSYTIKKPDLKIKEEDLVEVSKTIDGYLKYINPAALGGSHCFIIDYGLNEKELWNNFDVFMRIGELLEPDDEIYLDITHAFRSIPLFNYLMLDLVGILKFNNQIKLGGLFYGMLEASSELGYAPIVDLSPLYKITLWSRGAYNFINFGNGYLLAELIKNKKVREKIGNISDIVNINYIDDFKREVDSLNSHLGENESDEYVIKYMAPFLQSFTGRFKGISSTGSLQLALAKWYFENKRYAQGYICLAEAIITRILEIYRERDSKIGWELDNRKKVKKLLYNKLQYHNTEEYKKPSEIYTEISDIRNTIAHAGFIKNRKFNEDINKAYSYINKVEKWVFNNQALKNLPDLYPFSELRA